MRSATAIYWALAKTLATSVPRRRSRTSPKPKVSLWTTLILVNHPNMVVLPIKMGEPAVLGDTPTARKTRRTVCMMLTMPYRQKVGPSVGRDGFGFSSRNTDLWDDARSLLTRYTLRGERGLLYSLKVERSSWSWSGNCLGSR